jgi:hypothetical protein
MSTNSTTHTRTPNLVCRTVESKMKNRNPPGWYRDEVQVVVVVLGAMRRAEASEYLLQKMFAERSCNGASGGTASFQFINCMPKLHTL